MEEVMTSSNTRANRTDLYGFSVRKPVRGALVLGAPFFLRSSGCEPAEGWTELGRGAGIRQGGTTSFFRSVGCEPKGVQHDGCWCPGGTLGVCDGVVCTPSLRTSGLERLHRGSSTG